MATGTVKWFNTTKGFGFIAPSDLKVTFDVEAGRDGRESATNIALA